MSDEERGTDEGEGGGGPRVEDGRAPAPEGGLGILFLAAAMGLGLLLSLVGLIAYFAMSR